MITISITGNELRSAMRGFLKIIDRKSSLPVLNTVLITADQGKVSAAATNLDEFAVYGFRTAKADGNAEFLIGINELKAVSGGDVAIFELKGARITSAMLQDSQRLSYQLASDVQKEDFPARPEFPRTQVVKGWEDSYRLLSGFTSHDINRHMLQGVLTQPADNGSIMVATDGRRLTAINHCFKPAAQGFVTPVTKFLTSMKPDTDISIGLSGDTGARWIGLESGDWRYMVKAIEGTYPNFNMVIPNPPASCNTISIDPRDNLCRLLAGIPGDKSEAIILHRFRKSGLLIEVKQTGTQRGGSLKLMQSTFRGEANAIGVNRQYLLDALKAGFNEFRFEDELTPLLSVNGSATHVLMPMRIDPEAIRKAA